MVGLGWVGVRAWEASAAACVVQVGRVHAAIGVKSRKVGIS